MQKFEELRKSFEEHAWQVPFNALPIIRERGIILGHGTVLARMGCNRHREFLLTLHLDEGRLLSLLSAVYGRQVSPDVMHHISRASEQWRRGDRVMAQIELAYARFPRLETKEDAFRLFLADALLRQGMTPQRLMRELGFDPSLLKYDDTEPREPAGDVKLSGEWVKLGDDASGDVSAASEIARLAGGASFLENAAPGVLLGLARLIARCSIPTAIAGALLIPDSNSGLIQEGEVPGFPGVRYRLDNPERHLSITTTVGDKEISVDAKIAPGGLYVDRQGHSLGRFLSSSVYLDADKIVTALREEFGSDRRDSPSAATLPSPHPDEPKPVPIRVQILGMGQRKELSTTKKTCMRASIRKCRCNAVRPSNSGTRREKDIFISTIASTPTAILSTVT